MISIEDEMGQVRSDIESMEGRLNYLKSQVAFSTLKVSYYETIATDFGFSAKFIQSFKNGWNNLILFLIGIINVWPFLILASVLTMVALSWRKKTFRIGHNG